MRTTEHLPDCARCGGRPRFVSRANATNASYLHLECKQCRHRLSATYIGPSDNSAAKRLETDWRAEQQTGEGK